MAYVALDSATRTSRLAQASGRWERLAARRPHLAPAVALQRQLLEVAFDLLDAIQDGHVPRLSLPPRYVAAKLGRGVAALVAEPIPVPTQVLAPGLFQYCDILDRGGGGPAARHLGDALREGRIEPGSLLTASLTRDQHAIRKGAEHLGLAPDLVWLVAELTVSPFAHALQRRVLSGADPILRAALDAWRPGYCPACGSWPALVEVVAGQPVMRCSFCAAAWVLPADRCVYCRAEPPGFHTVQTNDTTVGHFQACDRCRGYLKVAVTGALSPFPLVAVTDLETTELDVEAMRQEYERPLLRPNS